MRKAFTYISLSILLFGIFGFIFNSSITFGGNTYEGELPLTEIQGIKENNNKIYIGLGFYNRIQVYDLDGNYLNYIKTNNYSKSYNFTIDEGLPILTAKKFGEESNNKYSQKNGSEYFKESNIPLIINKIDKNGEKYIIKQPIHMFFWAGPINSWLVAVVGLILFFLINSSTFLDIFGQNISKRLKVITLIKRIFR